MKRQYLGDEKDAFKWDYHDFLVRKLGYGELAVVLMMNDGDATGHGDTYPINFFCPKNFEIIMFCKKLKEKANAIKKLRQKLMKKHRADIAQLRKLPKATDEKRGGKYNFFLYGDKESDFDNGNNREEYFKKFTKTYRKKAVVFVDPDKGFETKTQRKEEHLHFCEVKSILNSLPNEAVVSVYQTEQKLTFEDTLKAINSALDDKNINIAALGWNAKVMFVQISKSKATIGRVQKFNKEYVKQRERIKGVRIVRLP